jgi:endo-1,4-beta-mannosidase
MSWWRNFDLGEVQRDFARIAEGGFDSVRIFLSWESFQPKIDRPDSKMFARLIATLDVASEAGLSVMPTLFTGHMSGVNWVPSWALGNGAGDERFRVVTGGEVVASGLASWYSDPAIVEAQSFLAGELASTLAGHQALWAWDLGNENSNCGAAPDKQSARSWLQRVTGAIRNADGTAKITIGLHMEDLEHDRNLGPKEAAEACDFLTMHGYPGYAPWTDGPTDERLLPFLARLTACLSDDAEVLFSEFGVPTAPRRQPELEQEERGPALVTEADAASYIARSLRALHRSGSSGAMLWCYSDYAEELFDEPPFDVALHERSFGLWRADSSAKPSVRAVQDFQKERSSLPKVRPLAHSTWFDLEVEDFYKEPEVQLPRLFRRYCSAATDNVLGPATNEV